MITKKQIQLRNVSIVAAGFSCSLKVKPRLRHFAVSPTAAAFESMGTFPRESSCLPVPGDLAPVYKTPVLGYKEGYEIQADSPAWIPGWWTGTAKNYVQGIVGCLNQSNAFFALFGSS